MSVIDILVIATFTAPEKIRANPQEMLWLLPLAAAIAVVYKATKLPKITASVFLKEATILFGSIVGFIIITALALFAIVWLNFV
jgi:ABC-type Co2+ transport system permease subunit